jgi:hypothetical protein
MVISITSGTAAYSFATNPTDWSYTVKPKYTISDTLQGRVIQLLGKTESGAFSGDLCARPASPSDLDSIAYVFASFYKSVLQNQQNNIPTRLQFPDKGIDVICALGDYAYSKSLDSNSIPYAISFDVVRNSSPMTRSDMSSLFNAIRQDIGFTSGDEGWHGGTGDYTLQPITGLTPNGVEVKGQTVGTSTDLASNSPVDCQKYAHQRVLDMGWTEADFAALVKLWNRESGWNYKATNQSSGAYGIVQSLPPEKMASAGADWKTNPKTQIEWGLKYIKDRYGSPSQSWQHELSVGWY